MKLEEITRARDYGIEVAKAHNSGDFDGAEKIRRKYLIMRNQTGKLKEEKDQLSMTFWGAYRREKVK